MNNVFIILVKPQLGQNIGSVARVMKNLNFKNLRIVNPRDGWPNQDVISTAAGADDIITCLLYTSPSPRDRVRSRMPSSA